jgi:hypothetical protein
MDFSDLLTFELTLSDKEPIIKYSESAHRILEENEVPYVCGGPNPRLLASLAFPPAKAIRNALQIRQGVYPAFHGGLYKASPFLSGTASAALGLAMLLAAGIPLPKAQFALSFAPSPDENALQAKAAPAPFWKEWAFLYPVLQALFTSKLKQSCPLWCFFPARRKLRGFRQNFKSREV